MKKLKFQTPTGMHDILSFEQRCFRSVINAADKIAEFYGFNRIETPILEEKELFDKGVGASTDIVQKEIFTLKSKGGDCLALRPEGTAPVVRAYIEHGMANRPQPVKLYYIGPFFRYERPQAGRYRQFWQFGLEIIGEKSPVSDTQIIQLAHGFFSDLGIKNITIEINSIGDRECRSAYYRSLTKFLRPKTKFLCTDCQKRTKENPLRVLDCKNEKCQEVIKEAPQTLNHLCTDCHLHFKRVLEYLDESEISYQLNPRLVRGLDYYTKTVFEFSTFDSEGKSLALGGGGRYDKLVEVLGGKETPAAGAAFGLERIVQIVKGLQGEQTKKLRNRVFFAQLGEKGKGKCLGLMEDFRKANITVGELLGKSSLKVQMARAAKIGAELTVIIGQRESLENLAIIRDMETGRQETVSFKNLVGEIKKRLKK